MYEGISLLGQSYWPFRRNPGICEFMFIHYVNESPLVFCLFLFANAPREELSFFSELLLAEAFCISLKVN